VQHTPGASGDGSRAVQARRRLEAAEKYRLAQQQQREELQAKALAVERQQQEERAYNAKCMRVRPGRFQLGSITRTECLWCGCGEQKLLLSSWLAS
jgi:hypothetical protein